MKIELNNIDQLSWTKMDQLLPCVVQHAVTGKVLMLGYMNPDAIKRTLKTNQVTFYSRSKQRLWTKGESSGHTLDLINLSTDCDNDALLALVRPQGPTCHKGTESCWPESEVADLTFFGDLERLLADRKTHDPDSSYTARLYKKGVKRIAQKVGEEGVETALAAATDDQDELHNEAADLLYHLIVLLQATDSNLSAAVDVLRRRSQPSPD